MFSKFIIGNVTIFYSALLMSVMITIVPTDNIAIPKYTYSSAKSQNDVPLFESEAISEEGPPASDVFFSYFNSDLIPSDLRMSNVVGEVTAVNLLRHTRILLTDETSNVVVGQALTDVREVLTSETGGKNIRNIIKNVGFILRDDNGSVFVQSVCKLANILAADQQSTGKILRTVITIVISILSHENAQSALEGLVEGVRIYFRQLTSEKVDVGVRRLKMSIGSKL